MKTNTNLRRAAYTAGIFAMSLLVLRAGAQPYNHRYPQSSGMPIVSPLGKSIVHRGCDVVSVNSIVGPGGFSDFHMTITSPIGAIINSFRFGNPGTNEYCNAICNSMVAPNAFFLAGKSHGGNMLVMRVNAAGVVNWSQEIVFPLTSEAITIVPIFDPPKRGYIAVGNCGTEVAAVKLDELGNILWAHTYPMSATYISNTVTDAVIHKALGFERILSIVGNHTTATNRDLFRLNLMTTDGLPIWQQFTYSNTAGYLFANPQVTNVGSGATWTDYKVIISFQQTNAPFSTNYKDLTLFGTDLLDPTIPWAYTYQKAGMTDLTNRDITRLSTGKFSALGTEHTLPLRYNPFVLNIDALGTFNYSHTFNEGRVQFAHSLMDNCASGNEILNGRDQNPTPANDLQIIANGTPLPDCTDPYTWTSIPANIVQTPVTITPTPGATAAGYSMSSGSAGLLNIFDCLDHLVMLKRDPQTAGAEDAPLSIYPNPANTHLTIPAGINPQTVVIFNTLGEQVLTRQVQGITTLDISHLPAGCYTLTRTGAFGESSQEKLVVQH